jgi:hypothetical protein
MSAYYSMTALLLPCWPTTPGCGSDLAAITHTGGLQPRHKVCLAPTATVKATTLVTVHDPEMTTCKVRSEQDSVSPHLGRGCSFPRDRGYLALWSGRWQWKAFFSCLATVCFKNQLCSSSVGIPGQGGQELPLLSGLEVVFAISNCQTWDHFLVPWESL